MNIACLKWVENATVLRRAGNYQSKNSSMSLISNLTVTGISNMPFYYLKKILTNSFTVQTPYRAVIRCSLNALPTSPTICILSEAGIPSLQDRFFPKPINL